MPLSAQVPGRAELDSVLYASAQAISTKYERAERVYFTLSTSCEHPAQNPSLCTVTNPLIERDRQRAVVALAKRLDVHAGVVPYEELALIRERRAEVLKLSGASRFCSKDVEGPLALIYSLEQVQIEDKQIFAKLAVTFMGRNGGCPGGTQVYEIKAKLIDGKLEILQPKATTHYEVRFDRPSRN